MRIGLLLIRGLGHSAFDVASEIEREIIGQPLTESQNMKTQ